MEVITRFICFIFTQSSSIEAKEATDLSAAPINLIQQTEGQMAMWREGGGRFTL